MSIEDLPDDLFLIILKKLGDEDCNYLGPIIRSNKRGRDIALSREVLQTANISPVCLNPMTNIFEGEIWRTFFIRCVHCENEDAMYFESLRLITRSQDVFGALSLLDQLVPTNGDATIAYAMFQMCAGRGDVAGAVFEEIFERFAGIRYHEIYSIVLEEMCQKLIDNLICFDPPLQETFGPLWQFPSTDVLSIPDCSPSHDEGYYCEGCYIYGASLRVCELL